MAAIPIYSMQAPPDLWILHDPLSGSEIPITPNVDREAVAKAVDEGACIIHQTSDGVRSLATVDEIPEPEPDLDIKIAAKEFVTDYVDSRVAVLVAALSSIIEVVQELSGQGVLPKDGVVKLSETLSKVDDALKDGSVDTLRAAAADIGGVEGPSIE